MIPTSIMASLAHISYSYSALISFTVYYCIYLSGGKGDKKARMSFDKSDISLGHINSLFITPPHTTGSLKAYITKVEGLVTPVEKWEVLLATWFPDEVVVYSLCLLLLCTTV